MAQIAREYLSPPVCFAASVHPGGISENVSLLELANGPALITAVKKAEAEDALVVRLHNPTSDEADAILTSRVPLASAVMARLDETPGESLQIERGPCAVSGPDATGKPAQCRIGIRLRPKQIATVLLYPATGTRG
jgi:alpha-mannosidase